VRLSKDKRDLLLATDAYLREAHGFIDGLTRRYVRHGDDVIVYKLRQDGTWDDGERQPMTDEIAKALATA
jgi:hypothetical protein